MLQAEARNDMMSSRHGGHNVSIVSKPTLWDQVAEFLDIRNRTVTVHKENKTTVKF
jgi:hypothetical protein